MTPEAVCTKVWLGAASVGLAYLFIAIAFTKARWFQAGLFFGFAGMGFIGVAIGALAVRQMLDFDAAAEDHAVRERTRISKEQLAEVADAVTPSLWWPVK